MSNYFVQLKNRGLIRIAGTDRRGFLQGLISNDINLLDMQPCVYACLLTPQGKFLHDFFITEKDQVLLIDCEGGERVLDLHKKLALYKLRADIDLSVEPDREVYVISGAAVGAPDPRHTDMGRRSFEKPQGLDEKTFEVWDRRRILLGIPDGSRDMVPGVSTLLECNIDRLNGISWDKGCYMGQELTARMHYRGLAKKHLYILQGDSLPADGEEVKLDGASAGTMRSSSGDVGMALLKDEAAARFRSGDHECLRVI